jgi:hypothetical protein
MPVTWVKGMTTMPDQSSRPVVVTSREVERIFSGKEAVDKLFFPLDVAREPLVRGR